MRTSRDTHSQNKNWPQHSEQAAEQEVVQWTSTVLTDRSVYSRINCHGTQCVPCSCLGSSRGVSEQTVAQSSTHNLDFVLCVGGHEYTQCRERREGGQFREGSALLNLRGSPPTSLNTDFPHFFVPLVRMLPGTADRMPVITVKYTSFLT